MGRPLRNGSNSTGPRSSTEVSSTYVSAVGRCAAAEPRSTEPPTVYGGLAGHQSCPYAHERLREARSGQIQFIQVPWRRWVAQGSVGVCTLIGDGRRSCRRRRQASPTGGCPCFLPFVGAYAYDIRRAEARDGEQCSICSFRVIEIDM